jgi:hypothetical protein
MLVHAYVFSLQLLKYKQLLNFSTWLPKFCRQNDLKPVITVTFVPHFTVIITMATDRTTLTWTDSWYDLNACSGLMDIDWAHGCQLSQRQFWTDKQEMIYLFNKQVRHLGMGWWQNILLTGYSRVWDRKGEAVGLLHSWAYSDPRKYSEKINSIPKRCTYPQILRHKIPLKWWRIIASIF